MEKISAIDKSIRSLMGGTKFAIDFYQREYSWGQEQIQELITDLAGKFNESHEPGNPRSAVDKYGRYFLGSIVISTRDGRNYIIDGQQRLTSITLVMIFLHRFLESSNQETPLADLIYSLRLGERSFNLDVPGRQECMEALYNGSPIDDTERSESVDNIVRAFEIIEQYMPENVDDDSLPFFADWLIENVHFVEITAQTDDDAYIIFETMNDRGISPTPADLLKGFLLANIDEQQRGAADDIWRRRIESLLRVGDQRPLNHAEPSNAIRAWLRAKYARHSGNQDDFDAIGTGFNRWVSVNAEGLGLRNREAYAYFVEQDFDFYCKHYEQLRKMAAKFDATCPEIFYNAQLSFTLQYPLLLAPLQVNDSNSVVLNKLKLVATYVDILLARRIWNGRSIVFKDMEREMYDLMVDIRGKNENAVKQVLSDRLANEQCTFTGGGQFGLNRRNRPKMKSILARLTDYIEVKSRQPTQFENYMRGGLNRYEIEHIWADHYDQHSEEFAQQTEFNEYRNRIGGLLLLPKSFNASFGDLPYAQKLEHYYAQNVLARSLNENCYDHNPGFISFVDNSRLPFKHHDEFKKSDLDERQSLYYELAELVWSPARLQ